MSLSPAALSSIEVVFPEIESTLHQAELSLTRFQEDRDSGEDLQNCIDCLNQLRGIFTVVEVQGCVLLCQEAVSLANEIPVGANDDKNGLLANLSNAIFILRRYSEYFHHQKLDHPQLLLPIINDLRKASKAKAFPESHFFEIDASIGFDFVAQLDIKSDSKLENFEHHAKRFRHMYQVGLLDLLKDNNPSISFRLIKRAAEGSAKLCLGEPLSQFWALVALVADVMAAHSMQVSDLRKRLFMRIEKYLREMAMVGKVVGSKSAPDSLKKELLYLLALSNDESDAIKLVLESYNVVELDFNETILQEEAQRLFGPGVDVLRSLSKAIQEELIQLKDKLDIFERGGEPNSDDVVFIVSSLERLSGTLQMLDLPNISELCRRQVDKIREWDDSESLVSEEELMGVADAILTIELATNKFEESGVQIDINKTRLEGGRAENSYLSEAKIVVIDESCSALVLAKRSISSFIESQGDKLHLANIAQVLNSVSGAMKIIGQERLAELISISTQCATKELYESDALPTDLVLETLADALSSLEYYIEGMKFKEAPNQELLKLASDSLKSIGYDA